MVTLAYILYNDYKQNQDKDNTMMHIKISNQ